MHEGPDWEGGQHSEQPPQGPQPMRLGTVIEVAVRILRRHWALLLLLSLLFAGPGALLTAATGIRVNEVAESIFPGIRDGIIEETAVITEEELPRILGALAGYVLAAIVAGLLASIGALGYSAVVAADYRSRRIELGEALVACLRRAPSLLAFILVTSLIILALALAAGVVILLALSWLPAGTGGAGGPGAFLALIVVVSLVVAVLYLSMRWAPAFPAIVVEGLGARQALARSWFLSADNVWRIFFIVAFGAVATALIAAFISQLLGVLIIGVLAPSLGLDELVAQSITLALGTVLLAAVLPVLTAVLYFDLRARRDLPLTTPPAREAL